VPVDRLFHLARLICYPPADREGVSEGSMARGTTWIATAAVLLTAACVDIKGSDYFEPNMDSDVGSGSGDSTDTGVDQPQGDPCASDDGTFACDPVTNAGCADAGVGCDYGELDDVSGFYCYEDATEPGGAACDAAAGPWCAAGHTCVGGVCASYCCGSADCGGEACSPLDLEFVDGPLGTCPLPEPDSDI
jgi:hypothetical protein